MTKEQILALPHLAVAETDEIKLHIHTEDGFIITDYFDDMDIKEYNSSECYFFPLRDEYKEYRVITVEEDEEYKKRQEEERDIEENNEVENVE